MSQQPNYIFPIILDLLSNKPLLCENENTLLKEIEEKLWEKCYAPTNLKKDLDTIVNLGKSLGILFQQDGAIGLPFLLKSNRSNSSKIAGDKKIAADTQDLSDDESGENMSAIPVPYWMEKDVRSMNADRNRNRYRSRSRRRIRNKPSVSKDRSRKLLKRRDI